MIPQRLLAPTFSAQNQWMNISADHSRFIGSLSSQRIYEQRNSAFFQKLSSVTSMRMQAIYHCLLRAPDQASRAYFDLMEAFDTHFERKSVTTWEADRMPQSWFRSGLCSDPRTIDPVLGIMGQTPALRISLSIFPGSSMDKHRCRSL